MPIYMKVNRWMGGFIKGEVAEADHKGWIALESVQLAVHRVGVSPRGARREEPAPPQPQEIIITKHQDASSDDLFKQSLWGTGTTIQIDFTETLGSEDPAIYMRVTLVGALFASFSISSAGLAVDGSRMETIGISAPKVIYDTRTGGRLILGEKAAAK
jgi:type VI protein secretion system component Hcp